MMVMKNPSAVRKSVVLDTIILKKANHALLIGDVRTEHFTYLTKEEWCENE